MNGSDVDGNINGGPCDQYEVDGALTFEILQPTPAYYNETSSDASENICDGTPICTDNGFVGYTVPQYCYYDSDGNFLGYGTTPPPVSSTWHDNGCASVRDDAVTVVFEPQHYDNGLFPPPEYLDFPAATTDMFALSQSSQNTQHGNENPPSPLCLSSSTTAPNNETRSNSLSTSPQYQYYDGSSPTPSYDHVSAPSSIQSSTSSSPPPSPTRGRGRPRKLRVKSESEKIRQFRSKKQILDEEVQKHGANAIYQGIVRNVLVSKDHTLAVNKIAESKRWGSEFLKKVNYRESVASKRGRKRTPDGIAGAKKQKNLDYHRRYRAQRQPGVFFQLLKDVLCQLKKRSSRVHKSVLVEIQRNCPNLYNALTQ